MWLSDVTHTTTNTSNANGNRSEPRLRPGSGSALSPSTPSRPFPRRQAAAQHGQGSWSSRRSWWTPAAWWMLACHYHGHYHGHNLVTHGSMESCQISTGRLATATWILPWRGFVHVMDVTVPPYAVAIHRDSGSDEEEELGPGVL